MMRGESMTDTDPLDAIIHEAITVLWHSSPDHWTEQADAVIRRAIRSAVAADRERRGERMVALENQARAAYANLAIDRPAMPANPEQSIDYWRLLAQMRGEALSALAATHANGEEA
jgi:hypothetical protein